jgi:hypothetical protein
MPSTPRTGLSLILLTVLAVGWASALAQAEEAEAVLEDEEPEDSVSGSLDDSAGSIEAAHDPLRQILYKGWQRAGDLRFGYVRSETDERDGSEGTTSDWRARLRYGGSYNVNEWLVFNARFAVACTSKDCDPELSLDPSETQVTTVDQGSITFDEFYLHAFRLKRFDVAIGRLQTKFTTRAGVYAKSLDRNNSNAVNINWTDGIHGAYHLPNESVIHFIAEYNDKNGASSVRRAPLDFTSSSARYGYFVAWESLKRSGPFTQRGIDVTYLPSSLLQEGVSSGPREDYIGIVARVATARPFGDKGRRWNVTGEIGYAPETPTKSAVDLAGDGDVDGLAWALTASIMDVWPSHSIGINYARSDPGWLLSPQYRDNEELFEIRYLWRKSENLVIDARVRWREELDQKITQSQKLDEFDFFARFTLRF